MSAFSQVYYNVTGDVHQSKTNLFISQGYRPIDISVSGNPPDVRYAAIWIRNETSVKFMLHHGKTAAEYKSLSAIYLARGMRPARISVTGPRDHAIFAGIWDSTMISEAAIDIQHDNLSAFLNDRTAWMFKEYGTYPSDRRYAVIFYTGSTTLNTWAWFDSDNWNTNLRRIAFCDWRAPANWTCVSATANENGLYCVTFANIETGETWSNTRLSSAQLEAGLATLRNRQMTPYCLQAYGGSYTLVGAKLNPARPRQMSVFANPATHGWTDPAKVTQNIDTAMEQFMKLHSVRYGQIAIGRKGTVLLARSYSWTGSPHQISTTDRMLLASVSKAFTCALVQKAYDDGKLTPDTKAFDVLGIRDAHDVREQSITIKQIVDHRAGFSTNNQDDPVFQGRQVAAAINTFGKPVTAEDYVGWVAYHHDLAYDPGTQYEYSNLGYVILSEVLRRAYGYTNYYTLLKDKILDPEGLDVQLWTTRGDTHYDDSMAAEGKWVGPSAINLDNDGPMPDIYGGDGMVKEACMGASSLAATASGLVKFAGKHGMFCPFSIPDFWLLTSEPSG